MKPAPFTYHRATSVEDAIAQLSDPDAMARPLAGGQSLVPMLNLRLAPVGRLVDLGRIDALKHAEDKGTSIRYGALLTHAAFEDRRVPDGSNGLMPYIGGQIAYRAVRTRGTIGGAIALADPAADWLTTVVALEGEIAIAGVKGRRTVAAADFVIGPYMTALEDGEIIEAIVVPRRPSGERWGHYKATRKTGEYADSMAIALNDASSRKVRLVIGATEGAPLVMVKASAACAQGASREQVAAILYDELAASGRDFAPAKLHLHRTTALRALQQAGLS
jgi:aerobic carbon-monoxide dehydrogenase medium subunit